MIGFGHQCNNENAINVSESSKNYFLIIIAECRVRLSNPKNKMEFQMEIKVQAFDKILGFEAVVKYKGFIDFVVFFWTACLCLFTD